MVLADAIEIKRNGSRLCTFAPLQIYTIEELKWDILILQGSGIGNDLK